MINFTYREAPAIECARKLIADGTVGRVMHVEASYLQCWLAHQAWGDWREKPSLLWRMSKKHRGGTLADIGCHILDLVSYAVGDIRAVSCTVKTFDKVVPGNTWRGYKLDADDSFIATVKFAGGAIGVIHSSRWASGHTNSLRVRVFGDKGAFVFDTDVGWDSLKVCVDRFHTRRAIWDTVDAGVPRMTIYSRFVRSILSGRSVPPTFEDGLKNQLCLEACVKSSAQGKPLPVKY